MKNTSTDTRFGLSIEAQKSEITKTEWLTALGECEVEFDADALTVREFADMLGISQNPARDRLRRLVRLGKAIQVRKRYMDGHGRRQMATAFKLLKEDGHARTSNAGRHRPAPDRRAPAGGGHRGARKRR